MSWNETATEAPYSEVADGHHDGYVGEVEEREGYGFRQMDLWEKDNRRLNCSPPDKPRSQAPLPSVLHVGKTRAGNVQKILGSGT